LKLHRDSVSGDSPPLGRHLIGAQFAALVDGSTEMLLERVAKLITPKRPKKDQD